jgi:hypothetical protein
MICLLCVSFWNIYIVHICFTVCSTLVSAVVGKFYIRGQAEKRGKKCNGYFTETEMGTFSNVWWDRMQW